MDDVFVSSLGHFRKRGMLVHLDDLKEGELGKRMFTTVGYCKCEQCGITYDRHPYIDNYLGQNGRPFLHLLCDGRLAKL